MLASENSLCINACSCFLLISSGHSTSVFFYFNKISTEPQTSHPRTTGTAARSVPHKLQRPQTTEDRPGGAWGAGRWRHTLGWSQAPPYTLTHIISLNSPSVEPQENKKHPTQLKYSILRILFHFTIYKTQRSSLRGFQTVPKPKNIHFLITKCPTWLKS